MASWPWKREIHVTTTPNTTLFTIPFTTSSRKSTPACIWDQNAPSSTPSSPTPTNCPPSTPIALNIAASNGTERIPARNRGATTRCRGSTAIMPIAASCSVVFMRPISAARAEPARPA